MSKKKYGVISIDCPWSFSDTLKMSDVKRSAQSNYNTMSLSEIKQLKIKDITDPNGAILALWVPSSLLQEGLDVMKEWGFTHKQTYVWVKNKKNPLPNLSNILKSMSEPTKVNWKNIFSDIINNVNLDQVLAFGMGHLFRQTHEICLIGINNNKIYKKLQNKSQRSVSFGENLKHSQKPDHLQKSLEIMFPTENKIEIFARRLKDGWDCIGNEVCNGEDIRVSISKL